MKEVCQQTGLTDRSVRYYIECGLLTPSSKDNYAGRKNYTFTREDVERLEKIKVLRGAGFGVEQIKDLLADRSTREIVAERLLELESEHEKNEQLLDVLQKANIDREVSLEELTIILSSTPTIHPQEETLQTDRFPYWGLLVASVGVLVVLFSMYNSIGCYSWIVESEQILWSVAAVLVSLPAVFKRSHWKRYCVIVGVLLFIPLVSVFCGFIHAPATMDQTHYEMLDTVPWDDSLYLERHGFSKIGMSTTLDYDIRTLVPDKEEEKLMHFRLTVEDVEMEDLSQYPIRVGDTYILERISVGYDSVIAKWFRCPSTVSRGYKIVSKGRLIVLWDFYDDTPSDMDILESVLKDLCADVAQIGIIQQPDENTAAIVNGVSIGNDAVDKRLLLNQVRNRAFTDLYAEVFPNETDREYYLGISLRADDRDGVLQELIRAEVIRQLASEYGEAVSYEDAVTACEAEHLLMRKDETKKRFYQALQNAMTVYSVEETELMELSYSLEYDILNESALKQWFSKSSWYLNGMSSFSQQFEEYVDSHVQLAEITIV